jgi:hypothetical protein
MHRGTPGFRPSSESLIISAGAADQAPESGSLAVTGPGIISGLDDLRLRVKLRVMPPPASGVRLSLSGRAGAT